jgi:transcription initiation factor TFIID subunit TAF12
VLGGEPYYCAEDLEHGRSVQPQSQQQQQQIQQQQVRQANAGSSSFLPSAEADWDIPAFTRRPMR